MVVRAHTGDAGETAGGEEVRRGYVVTVAALFVQTGGVYFGLDDVIPYDVKRNAMTYDGPHAVVAHPPCSRWCRLAGLVEARWGHKRGDDGGMFAHALDCVRRFGGVLEHPAESMAWRAFDLPRPSSSQWQRGMCGGWSAYVEQGHYGHRARKPTWLYAVHCDLPSLPSGPANAEALVSWCANTTKPNDTRPRLSKSAAARTPIEFRDVLIAMARSVPVTDRQQAARKSAGGTW